MVSLHSIDIFTVAQTFSCSNDEETLSVELGTCYYVRVLAKHVLTRSGEALGARWREKTVERLYIVKKEDLKAIVVGARSDTWLSNN